MLDIIWNRTQPGEDESTALKIAHKLKVTSGFIEHLPVTSSVFFIRPVSPIRKYMPDRNTGLSLFQTLSF